MGITYLLLLRFKNKADVRFVKGALVTEVSLSYGLPDLLAFPGSSNQWLGLIDQLVNLVLRVVGQRAQSCSLPSACARSCAHRGLKAVHTFYLLIVKL